MFPVFWNLKQKTKDNPDLDIKWVSTCQHKDLLADLEEFFQVKPNFQLRVPNSTNSNTRLGELGGQVLQEATKLFDQEKPDLIFVVL